MKILIVDNGTSYLDKLKRLATDSVLRVIPYSDVDLDIIGEFDAVILSGGHAFSVVRNSDKLQKEIEIIKHVDKPVFGICFGFELIAYTFGAVLELLPYKENSIVDIEIIEWDIIFRNISDFKVFESHKWIIKEPAGNLKVLAKSKDGIEAIKHKDRPMYGVQFHPEMFVDATCGDEIFNLIIPTQLAGRLL